MFIGDRVLSLFQNGPTAVPGYIFKIDNEAQTIDIYFETKKYETGIPMNASKFEVQNEYNNGSTKTRYQWIEGMGICLNGNLYKVIDVNETECSLRSASGSLLDHMPCLEIKNAIIQNQIHQCTLNNEVYTFPKIDLKSCKEKKQKVQSKGREEEPVNGENILFYEVDNSSDKHELLQNSKPIMSRHMSLTSITLKKRMSIEFTKKPTSVYIENTNLQKVPANCTGVIVAFRKKDEAINSKNVWTLGVILFHSVDKTVIIPMFTYFDCNGKRNYYLGNKTDKQIFEGAFDEITIHYLNHVSTEMVGNDSAITSSLHGPDAISNFPRRSKYSRILKALEKKYSNSQQNMSIGGNSILTQRKQRKEGDKSKRNQSSTETLWLGSNINMSKDKRTICQVGCTVVTIRCKVEYLETMGQDKVYLVPFVKESGPIAGDYVSYACISSEMMKELDTEKVFIQKKGFNSYLKKLSGKNKLRLKHFDLNDHPQGLLFEFIPTEGIDSPEISERKLECTMEHCQLDGLVLSHWYPISSDNAYEIKFNDLKTLNHVYGKTGFGSRHSVPSKGLNVYPGKRNQHRAIRTPQTCKEDMIFSQMHRAKFESTYLPIVQKFINQLTSQAVQVMTTTDRSYERFLHRVFLSMHKNSATDKSEEEIEKNGNLFMSSRRLCNWSIVTAGNHASKLDGFANCPHKDKGDKFFSTFQTAALSLLDTEMKKYKSAYEITKQLNYYKRMYDVGKGFALPTTCGYKILEVPSFNPQMKESDLHGHFLSIGLGVSVRLRSNIYHYFYGSIFSHCTAIPITVKDSRVTMFTGDLNVFAWGASGSGRRQIYERRYDETRKNKQQRQIDQQYLKSRIVSLPKTVAINSDNNGNSESDHHNRSESQIQTKCYNAKRNLCHVAKKSSKKRKKV